jgi:predicted phosphoadenosine phosphosulfate sulfurtransferase
MLKIFSLSAVGLTLAACMPAPPQAYLAAPADPSIRVRDPVAVSVTSGVQAYRVVDPKDWRELNRAVGPQQQ